VKNSNPVTDQFQRKTQMAVRSGNPDSSRRASRENHLGPVDTSQPDMTASHCKTPDIFVGIIYDLFSETNNVPIPHENIKIFSLLINNE